MKRRITLGIIGLALFGLGFASGRFIQHRKSGYYYEVRDMKEYESALGPVRWSYVTKSVGAPFLDTGTTILEIDGRTIYEAKRGFQESSPYARNINATQDGISWDDGDYRFDLTIQRMIGEPGATEGGKPPN